MRRAPGSTLLGWIAPLLLAGVPMGCCPPLDARPTTRSPGPTPPPEPAEPQVLEPSVELRLLREERLASMAPLEPSPRRAVEPASARPDAVTDERPTEDVADSESSPDADADREAEPEPDTEPEPDAEPDVRSVVVPRRSRLGTPENLFRARIRSVEPQRPRPLYVDRLLLRISGLICNCDGSPQLRDHARAVVTSLVERARPAIKACLAEDLARDPRVRADAPALLVVSQAMRAGPVVYRFVPTLDLGPHGVEVRGLGWPDDEVDTEIGGCLVRALEDADVEPSSLTRAHRVQVPLVAFSQHSWGYNLGGLNPTLALEAAALGWQHYERGEHEAALELFRDAFWVYHLGEYRYLEGLALEQLGALDAAADAYADYLAVRPYAPEATTLQERIDELRRRAAQTARRTSAITSCAKRGPQSSRCAA